ncbi:hypothetical protein GCM10011344_19790 [Dokdonia pacifica]|uniref:PQQ-like domain-containing protein n=1 Tax=Dokdonia pacifica TaxID=1627892 RepID=A0A238VPZ2_9FLAO|nr:PQQ-binding-like beta-propeller repeat protein [Dokdonia pacifica]GGG19224.1 hypothetical protein GCM10011344_19790 [Dokdonia pacifica]SNR36214.1 PQQ-like domain-containing protein [Dokdonia pacifica]
MRTVHFFVITLLLVTTNVLAQRAEEPDITYNIDGKINEMILTEVGTLIVASNDGLVGIKPESKEVVFNFKEYGRIKPEEVYVKPQTPYLVVDQSGFAAISTKKTVIDYLSGQTLFSSEKNGWKQVNICEIMMPQNKLVVQGQRKAKEKYANAIAIYDLNTGNQETFLKLKYSEYFQGKPLLLDDGIVMSSSKGTFKVDLNNGQELWRNDLKNVTAMITNDDQSEIYTVQATANGQNSKISKIGANGNVQWAKPHKVKGGVSQLSLTPKGLAIVSDVDNSGKKGLMKLAAGRSESKIAFLDQNSGADLWDKAPKTKGYVQHFYVMDDGILFGVYEGGINKISFDGKTLFKKPLKTGENIITMAETDQGLIYITSSDCNIVNLETGEQAWKKPLKYKRADAVAVTLDQSNNRYLLSTDEKLYAINTQTGEASMLTENKFEGKEEPSDIEVRSNGILRTSDQNMTMLDWEGKEVWHEYKRAPGKSAFGAILAGAMAVASAAAASASYLEANSRRDVLGNLTQTGEAYADLGDGLLMATGASVAEMLKKFKATAATKDAQFVLTKLDEGVGLVKLNKDTGAVEKEIVLRDKKPEYIVDDHYGVLYYKANNNTVYMYNLK